VLAMVEIRYDTSASGGEGAVSGKLFCDNTRV